VKGFVFMSSPEVECPPLLTARAAVDYVRAKTGAPLRLSRFYKDRAKGVAPKPTARFGNRDLFQPDEILAYGSALITPVEPGQDEAA
jgi:hypothetical protein